MPTVTGLTAARMEAIENQSIVDGSIVGDDLVLTRFDGGQINAGNVRGPQGIQGPVGPVPEAPTDGGAYIRRNSAWAAGVREAAEDGNVYARLDGAWSNIQPILDKAKYAAKGLIGEASDTGDRSLDVIGNYQQNAGASVSFTNNDDHVRKLQILCWSRIECDAGVSGLFRVYAAEVGSSIPLTRQAQLRVDGGGAAYAIDFFSEGIVNVSAGDSIDVACGAMKVTGGNGDMLNAYTALYDVGGIAA